MKAEDRRSRPSDRDSARATRDRARPSDRDSARATRDRARLESRVELENYIKTNFPEVDLAAQKDVVHLLAATKAPVCPRKGEARRIARKSITESLYHRIKLDKAFPPRCFFAFLAHCGFAIIYGLNVVMSFAIVTMVSTVAGVVAPSDCPEPSTKKEGQAVPGPKFDWDSKVQGNILAGYFYGYLVSQIPGAILADMFSAKWVMFGALLVIIVGCAVTPLAANFSWILLVIVRVVQGLAAGVTFPAMHIMISNWAPPKSRSIFCGVIYAGMPFGMIGSTVICAFVSIAIGWENMFYLLAALCAPWLVMWALFIEDTPRPSVFLTKNEAATRVSVMTDEKRRSTVVEVTPAQKHLEFPAKQVFKSKPFWAILVAHVGGNCGLYCLITQIPTFMKNVLHKDTKSNAIASVIPFVAMFIVSNTIGPILDVLRSRNKITTTTARKIGATICMMGPVGCLIALSFINCNELLATVWLTCALGTMGAQTVAYLGNHIDISPNFAGMLMGITNTLATIPGIVMPLLFGMLTNDDNSVARWSIGFYIICFILVASYIFYVAFASGEVQDWNYHTVTDEEAAAREEELPMLQRASMAMMAAAPPPAPATDPIIAEETTEEEDEGELAGDQPPRPT